MDKYVLVGLLFLVLAEIFSVVALFSSDWLVSNYVGHLNLGLTVYCHSPPGRDGLCGFDIPHVTWIASALLLVAAISVFTISVVLLVVSLKRSNASFEQAGKWAAFAGTVMLCMVGVLFPIGFSAPQFGGQPYLLPETYNVGYSYGLFNFAVLSSVIGVLVASRCFVPNLVRTNN